RRWPARAARRRAGARTTAAPGPRRPGGRSTWRRASRRGGGRRRCRTRRAPSAPEGGEDLGGRPLPTLDGAVDVAGPPLGGLGPRPVDAADRDPQRRPVDGPGARRQVGAVAAPGPGL